MKVAIVKQIYDAQGPWASVKWQETTPAKIFDVWPGTITFWGLACLLKADWYVVTQGKLVSDYVADILKNKPRKKIMEKYTKQVVDIKDIPLDDYDLVITLDPILEIPKKSKTLFAYFVPEHWDRLYNQSIENPLGNFDLFLAVMLDSQPELFALPQSVSFPYPFDAKALQSIFPPIEKKEVVWAEWRLLSALGMTKMWSDSAEKAVKRLEKVVNLPVYQKGNFNKTPFGITDPPSWKDALQYLAELNQCKYYIAVGRYSGPGQGIREAAALGLICIGEQDKLYHQMVCHPKLLCKDMVSMPKILKELVASPQLQKEALEYQYKALEQKFAKEPLELLQKAVNMKKQNEKYQK
ncbi:MAG: hypothetical protein EXS48_02655 [Candidatus Staskawiczbacteria bacterium]|nr:hypothetical protein [Candidatus Staskawiczbacteria bacterium]